MIAQPGRRGGRGSFTCAWLMSVLVLVEAPGCSKGGPQAQEDAQAAARASAASAWVQVRPPSDVALFEAPAEVLGAPEASGVVVPPFMARVTRIFVRPGERVARNAKVVAVIMPELVAAAGAYTAASTRLQAWGARHEQLTKLRAEGLVRATELAEVETRVADARAQQQTALATLRSGGLAAADARQLLAAGGVVPLRSPLDGVVLEVDVMLGEARDATMRPLVRIGGQGTLRIQARFAHAPPAGARFELVTAAGHTPLTLETQAPLVDPRDGTLRCWFKPPADTPLMPGQNARIRALPPDDAGLWAVPATAVLLDGPRAYVMVRDHEQARRTQVEVIVSSGAEALVRGLHAGQEVAAEARAAIEGAGLP